MIGLAKMQDIHKQNVYVMSVKWGVLNAFTVTKIQITKATDIFVDLNGR